MDKKSNKPAANSEERLSKSSASVENIVIWCTQPHQELIDYITEEYQSASGPDIEFDVQYFNDLREMHDCLNNTPQDELPNIVLSEDIRQTLHIFPDLAVSLNDYVDTQIFTSEGAVGNCSIEGQLRAFPVASYLAAFYYNRKDFVGALGTDLFEYISKDEFIEYAKRIKENIDKYIIAYYDDLARVLLLADGNLEFDENGKIVGDSVRDLFEFFEELKNYDLIYYGEGNAYEVDNLVDGSVCGVIGGYYWCQNIKNMLVKQGREQSWAVTNVPYGNGACSLSDTGCMVIDKEEEKLQSIVDFLKWAFVSNEYVLGMLALDGLIPVTPVPEGFYDNFDDEYFGNVIKFLASMLGDIQEIEYGQYEQQAMQLVATLSKKIVTGEMSAGEACNAFDEFDFESGDIGGGGGGGGGGGQPIKLKYIEVSQPPTKLSYFENERFSPDGMVVLGYFSNNSTQAITGYSWEPTVLNLSGERSITIIYNYDGKKYTTSQKVYVIERKIIGISATPKYRYYDIHHSLTNDDFKVIAEYNDGSTGTVSNFRIVNPVPQSAGQYNVKIEYTVGNNTFRCTVKIMVHDKLQSIQIQTKPNKLMYNNGDRFDNTGMTVIAKYADGIEQAVPIGQLTATPDIFKFEDGQTSADTTIAYTEAGIKKETQLQVYKKTGAELDDCDITQDFGGSGTGSVNLSSGRLTYKFTDFTCSDATFPISISRIYDVYADNIGVGNGWRLNLQQELKYEDGHWKYTDKNGKEHTFGNDFPIDPGRSSVRNETLGLDLFDDGSRVRLVDRSNNTLVFTSTNGVYRLVSVHKYPSTPDNAINAYSMNISHDSSGLITKVSAGRMIGSKRRTVQFVYANGLLTSLKYNFADNSNVVAIYEYSGNNLTSIEKCNINVSAEYSATTEFEQTSSAFKVFDTSSKDADGNAKSLEYTITGGKVSAISVGYGTTNRETTSINYTGKIESNDTENPETDVVASSYTEYNGTLSVMSFNASCATASYSYEIGEDGTYNKPKKVYSAESRGFSYKALADRYSDTLDVLHDDFKNDMCGWEGGIINTDKCICGTRSLQGSQLNKNYSHTKHNEHGDTLYLSLWAISSGDITVSVGILGTDGTITQTHKLDSKLSNKWQFTAFCLGKIKSSTTIGIGISGDNVCIDDVRLTRAPYEIPDDYTEPTYNTFGNITSEYAYNPVAKNFIYTQYVYDDNSQQLKEKIVSLGGVPQSRAVYSYSNGLLVGTKVYGTGANYLDETYNYTDYVQTKTTDVNGVITAYSEGVDYAQSTAWSNDDDSPSVTVKNTYYKDSNAVKQVSSSEYTNDLTYNTQGALKSAHYGSLSSGKSKIEFEYDTFGNMSAAKIGTVKLVSLEYNYKHLEKITYANGGSVAYTYGDKDRLTKITESGGYTASIAYSDNADDAVTVTDSNDLQYQSRTINTGGNTSEYTARFGTSGTFLRVVGRALNGAGNVSTTEIFANGGNTPFERVITTTDKDGQITELKREKHGMTSNYAYDGLYRLSSKTTTTSLSKTFKTEYGYSPDNIVKRAYTRIETERFHVGDEQKLRYDYQYYSNGNISRVTLSNKKIDEGGDAEYAEYIYDKYGRLKEEYNSIFGETYRYEYDDNGNIRSKSVYYQTTSRLRAKYEYDYSTITDDYGQNESWGDQLKKYDDDVIKYDAYGNPTQYKGKSLTWNGRKLVDIDGTAMAYDYNGMRIKKGNRRYFWQGNTLRMEQIFNQDGTPYALIYYYYDETGVCGMNYGGADYYFQKNMLGDVCAIYNSAGELQCRYVYDAWGNHKIYDKEGNQIPENSSPIGSINPFRYRGYYWDKEFGLYYLKSRYYDPEVGRFISPDSIEYLDPASITGMNLYAYCGNNPVMYTDPEGTLLGAVLAGLALWLFTPIGGIVTQAIVTISSYIGLAVFSLWDDKIRADMNAIYWNPFNSDESAVLSLNKVSFYKGMPVFLKDSGRSGSFYAIFLKRGAPADTLRHERGHGYQALMMGFATYSLSVAIPSWRKWGPWSKNGQYYNAPWETLADILGGVQSRAHSDAESTRAWGYYAVSMIFLPAAFFYLLSE